jgi:hypothetical protein
VPICRASVIRAHCTPPSKALDPRQERRAQLPASSAGSTAAVPLQSLGKSEGHHQGQLGPENRIIPLGGAGFEAGWKGVASLPVGLRMLPAWSPHVPWQTAMPRPTLPFERPSAVDQSRFKKRPIAPSGRVCASESRGPGARGVLHFLPQAEAGARLHFGSHCRRSSTGFSSLPGCLRGSGVTEAVGIRKASRGRGRDRRMHGVSRVIPTCSQLSCRYGEILTRP